MADIPKHTKTTITRHEWIIGNDSEPYSIARVLRDGMYFAQKDMEEMNLDVTFDDAFHWRAGEGGCIILFVDVNEKGKRVHV